MKKIKGLTEEEDIRLKVTLGRQRKNRFFEPIETSHKLKQAISHGETKESISKKVKVSVDMINKILRLNSIKDNEIISSIIWQSPSPKQISMSTASELARLENISDQRKVFKAILEHNFTKSDVKELVTLFRRADISIEECISQIKEAKLKTIHTNIMVGRICSEYLLDKIKDIKPLERNQILKQILEEKSIPFKGVKLEKERFLIIGDEKTYEKILLLGNDFEKIITGLLIKRFKNEI
jgi:hypothetical protein